MARTLDEVFHAEDPNRFPPGSLWTQAGRPLGPPQGRRTCTVAGFGRQARAELLRDVEAGPAASVERLFHPPQVSTEDIEAIDGLR